MSKKILITAGPTREFFDPVRFLSNPSSGKMGYALAAEATRLGFEVTLVSGPASIPSPSVHRLRQVVSADDMYRVVMKESRTAHVIIMTAAVSDYKPSHKASKKLKKSGESLTITLKPTRDILKELGRKKKKGQLLVGFAAETDRLLKNAQDKLKRKNLDAIIANDVSSKKFGFESENNQGVILKSDGSRIRITPCSKQKMAQIILKELTKNL